MFATLTTPDDLLGRLFDDLLTPESAARVVDHALPPRVLERLEVLREKAGEGRLDPAERREYAKLIDDMDLIALVQLRARRLLASASSANGSSRAGA